MLSLIHLLSLKNWMNIEVSFFEVLEALKKNSCYAQMIENFSDIKKAMERKFSAKITL